MSLREILLSVIGAVDIAPVSAVAGLQTAKAYGAA